MDVKDQNYNYTTTARSFLQSPEWESFQHSLGREARRIAGTLLIRHPLPRGFHYLYCPHPEFQEGGHARKFFREAEQYARKEKSIFLKIDPRDELRIPANYEYKKSDSLQPRKTALLDVKKSEDEILACMHPKTRYNIRLAEKRGATITNYKLQIVNYDTGQKNPFETFWKLLQETAKRDTFHTHEKRYYEKLLAIHAPNFSNELFFAESEGRILAAALINFYHAQKG
ncbi:MAG: pentaglycine interpeptide bridge formation protein, partial [Parcubacteria group bacterium Gr01-1014_33]